MDGQDDRTTLSDTAKDPSNLKRKRPIAGDSYNSTKRHDSRTSVRFSTSDTQIPPPVRRRDRSSSADSRTSSQKRRRYSPERTYSRDDERSPMGSESPLFVRRDSRDEDYRRRNLDRGPRQRSPESYQRESYDRNRDQHSLDRKPRPRSDDQNGGQERSPGLRPEERIPPHATGLDKSSRDIRESPYSSRITTNEIDISEKQSTPPNGHFAEHKSATTPDPVALNNLIAILGQFGKEVVEQSSLQLQRDSMRKSVDQKRVEYEKGSRQHKSFPALEESQKAALEKAEKNFDAIEQQLKQKQASTNQTIREIAERILPSKQEANNLSIQDFKDRLEDIAREQRYFEAKFDSERKKWSDSLANWSTTENNRKQELAAVRVEISKLSTRIETAILNEDPTAVNSELKALSSKVESLRNSLALVKPQDDMKSVNSNSNADALKVDIERLQNAVDKLNKEVIGEEDDFSLRVVLQKVEDHSDKFHIALKQLETWVNEDVGTRMQGDLAACSENLRKLENRLESLEGRHLIAANENTGISSAIVDDLKDELKILSEGQDQVGISLDEFTESLARVQEVQKKVKTEVHQMKTTIETHVVSYNELQAQMNEGMLNLQNDARAQKSILDGIANSRPQQESPTSVQLIERISKLDGRVASIDVKLSGVQQSCDAAFNPSQQVPQPAIPNVHHLFNSIEGLKVAYNNLDSRMNNLSTESLARMMLGQLDSVYPTLRNTENALTDQKTRNQVVDKRLGALEARPAVSTNSGDGPSLKDFMELSGTVTTVKVNLVEVKDHFENSCSALLESVGRLEAESEEFREELEKAKTSIYTHEEHFDSLSEEVRYLKKTSTEHIKTVEEVKSSIGNLQERASNPKANTFNKANGHPRRRIFDDSDED